jgi:hypothetical protein
VANLSPLNPQMRRLELPGRPPAKSRLPALERALTDDFVRYRDRQRTLNERAEWLEFARGEISYFTERLFNHPLEHLEAIGAVYRPVSGYSRLKGFQSRLPQDVLEQAFVKKFFYETLLTHPSIVSAYQAVEAAGLQTAAGNRFPTDHPLLRTSQYCSTTARTNEPAKAYTFEDFGFSAHIPNPRDEITESTSAALASGGTLSWLTHRFPSQYVMGSAMPELWSDMSLAAGAKMFMLMITPCDGAVATPEEQLARYRSAQELIRRDPAIRFHPYAEFILPSGEKLKDFLVARALMHLGAAVKPGDNIVEIYKPLIVEAGCQVVEVYDPGCTKLLLKSVRALRDHYGPDLVILAGRLPPDPDKESFLSYVTELNRERVTLREGLLDGKICKTFKVSGGMAPMNFQSAARIVHYSAEIQSESSQPVIVSVESGASERLGTAIAAGIAGVSISGSLAGTVVEHVPALHEFAGKAKPYGGEASEVVKIRGGKVNAVGDPLQVEGASGTVKRNGYPGVQSQAHRVFDYLVGVTKGNRFARQDSVIGTLVDAPESGAELVLFSDAAKAAANVHLHE